MGKHLLQISCRHEKSFVAFHPMIYLHSFPYFGHQEHSHTLMWAGTVRVILLIFHNPVFQSKLEVMQGESWCSHTLMHHHPILLPQRLILLHGRLNRHSWCYLCACISITLRRRGFDLDSSTRKLRLLYNCSGCCRFFNGEVKPLLAL